MLIELAIVVFDEAVRFLQSFLLVFFCLLFRSALVVVGIVVDKFWIRIVSMFTCILIQLLVLIFDSEPSISRHIVVRRVLRVIFLLLFILNLHIKALALI